ncbi:hypothetical protein ACI76O_08720 [Capnocytophaga cynodegmi]|uniref:hypothetical protein n=1 Tax=Capnocytophaga cynodegmi TaxID=28189 RepID=UPI00385BA4B7
MLKFKLKICLFWLLLSVGVFSQQFPVNINTSVFPPYTQRLADLVESTSERFKIQLQLLDLNSSDRNIEIGFSLENASGQIIAQTASFQRSVFRTILRPGSPLVLSNLDLKSLLSYENLSGIPQSAYYGLLPEGSYFYTFIVYDALTGQPISRKNKAFFQVRRYQPPLLTFPVRGASVTYQNTFQNLIFQWSARDFVPNVQYIFTLREIIDVSRDPNSGFISGIPVYESVAQVPTILHYAADKPFLQPGKRYGWQVRAIQNESFSAGNLLKTESYFHNGGLSEVFWFDYMQTCDAPKYPTSVVEGTTAIVRWDFSEQRQNRFRVEYREIGKSSKNQESQTTEIKITGLRRNKEYEYRVGVWCGVAGGYVERNNTEGFTYGNWQKFHTENILSTGEEVQCGMAPDITITNQEPLQGSLGIREVFTAGDFPVTVVQSEGTDGQYSGVGYVEIPYLQDTKIVVKFNNIRLNNDRQLISGVLETSYDKTESNVILASEELRKISEGVKILTEQESTEKITEQTQNNLENEKIKNNSEEMTIAQDTEKDSSTITTLNSEVSVNEVDINKDNNTLDEHNNSSIKIKGKSKEKTGKKVYFSYKNRKYENKDTITIPYNRNKKITLGIEGIDKNEYVNWLSKDGLERTKYISNRKRTVNTEVLNSLKMLYYAPSQEDFLNKKYDTLQAFLRHKYNDFTIKELYARDLTVEEGKREAKSGETLYMVSGPVSKGERNEVAEYEVVISPKLKEDNFPTYHLKWDYGYPHTKHKDEGKLKMRKPTYEKWKGLDTISITGGYPQPITKKVMVKTIYENRTTFSAMPPGVSEVLTKRIEQIGDQLRFVDRKIKLGMKFKIDPIKISGETYNQEMKNSPLYEQVREWSITGGMTAQANATVTHPIFNGLERANILRFGVFASMGLTFGVKGTIMQTKPINKKEFKMETSYADIFGTGCLDFGIVAQLLVAKETIDCEVKGYAKGCVQGRIRYDLKDNKVNSKESSFFIPPVVLGFKAKVKSKGWVEFELVDFEGEIALTEQIDLFKDESR